MGELNLEEELKEFYERISELLTDLTLGEISYQISVESTKSWLMTWKAEMGRNIDIIWQAIKEVDKMSKDLGDDGK